MSWSESAGVVLVRSICGALPPGVSLDEREQALLAAASAQADAVQALEADIERAATWCRARGAAWF